MVNDSKADQGPASDDQLSRGTRGHPRLSASPAGVLLANFLNVMHALGHEAEEAYQRALKQLQEHVEDVVVEIARATADCGEQDYPFRLALAQAAVALRHPGALPYLAAVVKTPIPSEQSADPHSFSTVAEETIIRTTAVDGIAELASQGDERAVALLLEFVGLPSFSIRRASVHGLLRTKKGAEYRERIRLVLPEDQRFILNLRNADVREVPQVRDPTPHLKERLKEGRKPAPPRVSERRDKDSPRTY